MTFYSQEPIFIGLMDFLAESLCPPQALCIPHLPWANPLLT